MQSAEVGDSVEGDGGLAAGEYALAKFQRLGGQAGGQTVEVFRGEPEAVDEPEGYERDTHDGNGHEERDEDAPVGGRATVELRIEQRLAGYARFI